MACEIRVEGGLEAEEMYFLYNYNEDFQITPVNQSSEIYRNKAPKSISKFICKLKNLNLSYSH